MAIVIFLLMLSFLVIIHELGHFVTARWMKVKIEEFGIGYPPRALTLFHWKGIPFTLNWLPFGGFVKMQGEDGEGEDREIPKTQIPNSKKIHPQPTTHNPQPTGVGPFYTKSKRARLLVLLAGVTVNFLFGFFAFSFIYTRIGIPTPSDIAKIQYVAEGAPAQTAGLQAGDVIKRVVSPVQLEIKTSDEFVRVVNDNLGQTLTIVFERSGVDQQVEVYARTKEDRGANEGAIGVAFESMTYEFYPWWQMPFRGMWVGMQQSLAMSLLIVQGFGQLFFQIFTQAKLPSDIAGPVGIVHQASKTGMFTQGPLAILNFAAMLSINLAILNILPIPALDGGRAMFVILETVIGKKWREKIEGRLNTFGFAMLILLIVVITAKDVWSLVKEILL